MKHLFIALFIAFPLFIFAQSNYKEGYVLKNNGDTLKGYIDYKDWANSPTSIEFKINKTDNKSQQFDPKTIKAFQINGFENYTSYVGIISANRNVFPDLPIGLDTSNKQGAIFLKQLVTGSHITLFYNNEAKKNRFFISETNEQPVELKYYDYYQNSGGQEVYDNLYRGQLLLYIYKFNNGDEKLKEKLEYVKFEQPDLESIVSEINNSGFNKVNNKSGIKRASKTRFYIGGGINYTTTDFNYTVTTTTVNALTAHSNMISPVINFGMDVFTNPDVQKFIFRTDLSFAYFNTQFNKTMDFDNSIQAYNITFLSYNISITPQFIYNFYNTDKFKVYGDIGVAFNFPFHSTETATLSNQINGTSKDSFQSNRSSWPNCPLQIGVVLNKRVDISLAFIKSAEEPSSYLTNHSLCLGFKYLFGNK